MLEQIRGGKTHRSHVQRLSPRLWSCRPSCSPPRPANGRLAAVAAVAARPRARPVTIRTSLVVGATCFGPAGPAFTRTSISATVGANLCTRRFAIGLVFVFVVFFVVVLLVSRRCRRPPSTIHGRGTPACGRLGLVLILFIVRLLVEIFIRGPFRRRPPARSYLESPLSSSEPPPGTCGRSNASVWPWIRLTKESIFPVAAATAAALPASTRRTGTSPATLPTAEAPASEPA